VPPVGGSCGAERVVARARHGAQLRRRPFQGRAGPTERTSNEAAESASRNIGEYYFALDFRERSLGIKHKQQAKHHGGRPTVATGEGRVRKGANGIGRVHRDGRKRKNMRNPSVHSPKLARPHPAGAGGGIHIEAGHPSRSSTAPAFRLSPRAWLTAPFSTDRQLASFAVPFVAPGAAANPAIPVFLFFSGRGRAPTIVSRHNSADGRFRGVDPTIISNRQEVVLKGGSA